MSGKSLKTLIRLGKWTVDEKRRVLAALYEREDRLVAAIDAMDRQFLAERATAAADPLGAGITFPPYAQHYRRRREEALRQLEGLRREIEVARDDLAESYRTLKTYEIASKQRIARERAEAEHKEQLVLDEIGQTLHRRRTLLEG